MQEETKPKLLVVPCDYKAAKYAVEHWHYSKSMPSSKNYTLGVWEDNVFIGAIIFGRGANNNIGKPYVLSINEICELTRVALNAHKSPVSQIVSIALKILKNHFEGMRLVGVTPTLHRGIWGQCIKQ